MRSFLRLSFSLFFVLFSALFGVAQERVFLYFQWNDSQWNEAYFRNGEIVDSLAAYIERIGPERIDSLEVVAYASPEGTYGNNMRLSRERAEQFGYLLRYRLPAFSGVINVRAGGEAWTLLRDRVSADPKIRPGLRERILQILDDLSVGDETRKWRLANRLEESDYRYLLYAHYRYLRCFEIMLHFKAAEPEPEPEQESVPEPVTEPECKPEPEPQVEPVEQEIIQTPAPEPVKKKPLLAISTNLPYDITYVPNYGLTSIPSISLEYYPASYGHWSFGADVEFPMWRHWDAHRFMQIQNLTIHTRYYISKGNYRGLYALASVNAAQYGIGWDAKGWEGEGMGVSAGVGFKKTLYGRLFLDAGISLGYFHSLYDPYEYGFDATKRYYYDYVGLPEDFIRRNYTLDWIGPTRIWISVGIDLFGRKAK